MSERSERTIRTVRCSARSAGVVDAGSGRVVLTRAQLGALADHASGRHPKSELVEDLRAAGALSGGSVHPLLRPVLRTMATIRGRGALRRWRAGAQPVVEVLVGDGGVVTLPAGPGPDAPQELRWHPRPSAVARIVAELIDLPAEHGAPAFDSEPRAWTELVDAASHPGAAVGLADLRWADRVADPLVSVLVVAWRTDGGTVEVEPVESPESPDVGGASTEGGDRAPRMVRCTPRHPLEVWTGLTTLAARTGRPR
jgi:hypothetical protein